MRNKIKLPVFIALLLVYAGYGQSALERAERAYQDKKWEEVALLYNKLVKDSPFHGDFHYRAGRAHFMLGALEGAEQHFKKAIENGLSSNNGYAMYYLARIAAKQNKKERAYDLLSKAINYSPDYIRIAQTEKDFSPFVKQENFIKLLGTQVLANENPNEAWREELFFLKNRMEKSHYDIFHATKQERWDSTILDLHNSIPEMSTNAIMIKFSEIGALAMDSHSYANPLFGNGLGYRYQMLPIEFYFFEDKLYVRAAADEFADLVGKEVVKVGNYEMEKVYQLFQQVPITGLDNCFQLKWQLPWFLRCPQLLFAKGISSNENQVTLVLKNKGGTISNHLVESEIPMNPSVMQSTPPDNWINMNSDARNPVPLYLQNPNTTFWYKDIEDHQLAYVQINNMRDMKNESMEEFVTRFLQQAVSNRSRALILDVRLNNGGNAHLGRQLVKKILKSKFNEKNKLFIIIGRNTFSATMPPIAALDLWSEAIFVGEPTGTRPNFIAEGNMFQLPYSKMYASVSNNYWQGGFNSNDSRKWIAPELGAAPNVTDYTNNIDPAIHKIVSYLEAYGE